MDKNKIKVSDIASAEKILGVEYSKEEREQMIIWSSHLPLKNC